jgi:glycogen phosphorylase
MIGGKAAPGYYSAKVIIELINRVGQVVNNDSDIGDLLKVVFLPNYCVSSAQIIIPASELSQHISTAGTEASGTSNMKFVMNGGLIIGTMDGANVEIAEECGEENMFIFGMDVQKVAEEKAKMYGGFRDYVGSRLGRIFEVIKSGRFGGDTIAFQNLINNLTNGQDQYLVCHDFYSYMEANDRVDAAYRDQAKWNKMAIECVARSGKFSSDRTIQEYCDEIWKVEPVSIPHPSADPKSRVRSFANLPI